MKTRQEMFDIALNGVRKQGRLSQRALGACRYRTRLGGAMVACNVGHPFPDSAYHPDLDMGLGALCDLARKAPETEGLFGAILTRAGVPWGTPDDLEFLSDLQSAHDNPENMEDYETYMQAFAQKYKLNYKEQ